MRCEIADQLLKFNRKFFSFTLVLRNSGVVLSLNWKKTLYSSVVAMNFFKNVVSKLFDKEEEAILNDCIAFDESGLVFTVFVRGDLPRERLKFVFQEYVRQKQWNLRHTGPASMTCFQQQPEKRTMQGM